MGVQHNRGEEQQQGEVRCLGVQHNRGEEQQQLEQLPHQHHVSFSQKQQRQQLQEQQRGQPWPQQPRRCPREQRGVGGQRLGQRVVQQLGRLGRLGGWCR